MRVFKFLLIVFLTISFVISQQATADTAQADPTEVTDSDAMQQFQQYIKDYDRVYESLEHMTAKYLIFKQNYKQMKELSKTAEHKVGITKFMDMKPATFAKEYMTIELSDDEIKKAKDAADEAEKNTAATGPAASSSGDSTSNPPLLKATPTSFDWRSKGVIGVVKDQGACGSCWAHSSSGNIESMYAIKYGTLYNLSVSQLVDCNYTNDGCVGGNQANAFAYLKGVGLTSEAAYPYRAYKSSCKASNAVVRVSGYQFVSTNEESMKNWIASNGPLSVVFNANLLQYYTGGILTASAARCPSSILNHAVLIVGFGTSGGTNYWIVKNSYGPNWGENGYFRIARGYGTCGINQYVLTSTVA